MGVDGTMDRKLKGCITGATDGGNMNEWITSSCQVNGAVMHGAGTGDMDVIEAGAVDKMVC